MPKKNPDAVTWQAAALRMVDEDCHHFNCQLNFALTFLQHRKPEKSEEDRLT